jgi:RNA polymerase sigma-70 factor (ECF subfamily)
MRNNSLEKDPKILIDLAKKGNKEAFGILYEIYFVPVFRYIFARVNSREETEDLVQEVFLKVYKNIKEIDVKENSPLNYFFTVAKNSVIDYWRRKKEVLTEKEMNLSNYQKPEFVEKIEQKEMGEIIKELIKELTPDQQEVIVLRFINEMSNKEIAKLLGKTEEAVRQLQSRALKSLREKLKNLKII